MTADPPKIVEAGYDAIARRYLAWAARVEGDPRPRFLAALAARLPDGAEILDLGCGAGESSTRLLAERFSVTGVDVSAEQLRLARDRVPAARFVKADMASVRFPPATFDAVTAFYSIIHVPRSEHGALLARIASWLRPGGLLLATLGAHGSDDAVEADWLGVPMFFSSHDSATNSRLLAETGFTPIADEVVTIREPEGDATFQWVLASLGRGHD